ncbi:MAG: DHA2 family efflux MFS transporter permease subunit [Alphaproteobacteria bacterium]
MAADAEIPTGLRRWAIVLASTLGTAAYDFTWTVVGIALPPMQGTFSATPDQVAWVMTGFIVGSAMMMACIGFITSHMSRKTLFLVSLAAYTVTLIGCGLSGTLTEIVVWRFLQGLVGAPLIPIGQAIAVDAFPARQHGKATSIWGIAIVAGGAFGPVGGGMLIEHLGWPWIFYITAPFSIAAIFAVWFVVPEVPREPARKLDGFGFVVLMVAIVAIQMALSRGERQDWFDSPEIIAEALIAGIAVYLFVVHTCIAKQPFINRALFQNWNYAVGLVFLVVFGAVIILPNIMLPLMLAEVSGYSAIETGYLMIPRGFGVVLGLIVIGQIDEFVDPRIVITIGLVFVVFTAWEMAQWTVNLSGWDVAWTNFLQGIASGAMWVPVSALALGTLPRRFQSEGYSVFYLQFDIGSAIGVAGVIAIHTRNSQANHAVLTEHVTPFNELLRYRNMPEIWDLSEAWGRAALDLEVSRQAAMIAYNNSFLLVAMGTVALLPLVFLFRPPRHDHDYEAAEQRLKPHIEQPGRLPEQ